MFPLYNALRKSEWSVLILLRLYEGKRDRSVGRMDPKHRIGDAIVKGRELFYSQIETRWLELKQCSVTALKNARAGGRLAQPVCECRS